MKRAQQESFKKIYQQFEKHLTTMHDASATIPSDKELVKLLFIGLDSETICANWFNYIVNDSNPPSMPQLWSPSDLQYTYNKAEIYVNNIQSLGMSTVKQNYDTSSTKSTSGDDTDSSMSSSTSTAALANKKLCQCIPTLEAFYRDLLNTNNKASDFKKYREKLAGKCCFHTTIDNHEFMQCKCILSVVAEAKCIDEWCNWKAAVQFGAMMKKENENAKRAATPTPVPALAPTPNPKKADSGNSSNLESVQEAGYESKSTVDSKNKDTTHIYVVPSNTKVSKFSCTLLPQTKPTLIKHHVKHVTEDINPSKNSTSIAVPDSSATSNFSGQESFLNLLLLIDFNRKNEHYFHVPSFTFILLSAGLFISFCFLSLFTTSTHVTMCLPATFLVLSG